MNHIEKAYAILALERKIVGVKLVRSKEEFDCYEARELIAPLSYCVAVKCATNGHALKFVKETSGCIGSTRALGLVPLDQNYCDGSEGYELGLYPTKKEAVAVARAMENCPADTYGVIVKPIEQFEQDPDLVILIANTKEMMRIVQGYTYSYGMQTEFTMSGNQAICVECSAYPINRGKMNVSVFCAGTRYKAKWKDNEMAAGIPYSQFNGLIDGIYATINPVERKQRKLQIAKKLDENSVKQIDYTKTYYMKEK